jgi:hypothetical protein
LARIFFWSVLAGAVLAVLGLLLLPLPEHARVRSDISVVNNGGRAETFTIQWPRDRVEIPPSSDSRIAQAGPAVALRAPDASQVAVEVFRLRDSAGKVVGVASRTISQAATAGQSVQGSDWMLLIPSRGALFMTEVNAANLLPRPLSADSTTPVAATDQKANWTSSRHLQISAGPAADGAGQVLRGTEEFSGLTGVFRESWDLDEAPGGPISGRITLATELRVAAQ